MVGSGEIRPKKRPQRYCQLNEDPTLNTPFAWRESIDLSGIRVVAPRVDGARMVKKLIQPCGIWKMQVFQ